MACPSKTRASRTSVRSYQRGWWQDPQGGPRGQQGAGGALIAPRVALDAAAVPSSHHLVVARVANAVALVGAVHAVY
jgi:hypothetical protein